jgi:predicted lipoprotein with Yx(FWY)xxD motif
LEEGLRPTADSPQEKEPMRLVPTLAAGALLLVACTPQTGAGSAPPSAGSIEITVSHTSAGDALAGPNGKTLYTYANDTDSVSNCNGGCADAWPPLLGDGAVVEPGEGVSGTFGTTTRDDGSTQVTHNGQPLYYYASDTAAGDAKGEGVGGVWSIAQVGEASASSGAQASESESEAEQPSATPYRAPGY